MTAMPNSLAQVRGDSPRGRRGGTAALEAFAKRLVLAAGAVACTVDRRQAVTSASAAQRPGGGTGPSNRRGCVCVQGGG
eukprot:233740-Prymnesium_polylepis.1